MSEIDLATIDQLKITMYFFEAPYIRIKQVLYFKGDELKFEGYDIGERVKEAFGDSDYEYDFEVQGDEVQKFYSLFNVAPGDRKGLLLKLYERFAGNHCYSEMCAFMDANGIESKGFSY